MNPNDKAALKAEISGLEAVLGGIGPMIGAAKNAANTPQASIPQICSALEALQQFSQRLSKLLGSIVEKS